MRIGVVGAGAAGLTAAHRAVQAGHDVVEVRSGEAAAATLGYG